MNKKGQELMSGISLFLLLFVIVVAFFPFFKFMINNERSSDNLDCTNESISTGQRATCVLFDFYFFYWVIVVLGSGMGYILGKQYVGNG